MSSAGQETSSRDWVDSPARFFAEEEIDRARRYHRPIYLALAASTALHLAVLAAIAFTLVGDRLYGTLDELPWWGRAAALAALAVVISTLVRLPFSFWRGYLHERRWGFSTQTIGGWLADRAKALAVAVVLGAGAVVALGASARLFPSAWPAVAAPGAALLVVFLTFVAPLVLEPLFNRFTPVDDRQLADDLRGLAGRAGVPVRDVLVADASRRTRKSNAYVSGLGSTRRVVLFDTLLGRASLPELRLVVAHELGHRRAGHVAKSTLLAMAAAALAVVVMWALLGSSSLLAALDARGPQDPRVAPFVLLVGTVLELVLLPFGTALSRHWERDADRFSLDLTGDLEAFERAHRDLASANLAELDPPRVAYVLLFTHPTPPQRIAAARAQAAERRHAPLR